MINQTLKTAIVHDWLTTYAGSERCVESFTNIWNNADIYSLVDFLNEKDRQTILKGKNAKTSFVQKLPLANKYHRHYFPLFPLAVEQFDLSGFDLVISSSHAVAKGVITGPQQLHISYCHSPIRYAWDLQHEYRRQSGLKGVRSFLARASLHYIRNWDTRSANGVGVFVANSRFIAQRV